MANHYDDREVFEAGFRAWSLMSTAVRRLWLTAMSLPNRGRDSSADDPPPEYFRFLPFQERLA